MEIAKYGRTVIVDDQVEDIVDLIKVLSQEGISTTYFTGDLEQLPEKPLEGISMLFLDLELNKLLANDRDKVSQDISVIRRILGEHAYDGTVILIIWTTAISAYDELKTIMSQVKMRFLTEITVEKSACKTEAKFDFQKIKQILSDGLIKLSALDLLNIWDNIISVAAHRVYEKIIDKAPTSHEQLAKHINTLYIKMVEAVCGKQEEINITAGIIQVLNGILENEICSMGITDYSYEIDTENIGALTLDRIGDMNRALNLVPVKDGAMPGTVYELTPNIVLNYFELFNDWKSEVKRSDEFSKRIEIMCEVTPLCDYAQKRRKFFRMLPGVILPVILEEKLKKRADYIYCTPTLNDKKVFPSPFVIVFDLRFLFTVSHADLPKDNMGLQIGENMLMHIQNKIGRQVSNPGITFIDRK